MDLSPFSAFGAWACRVAYLEVLKFREGRKQGELSLSPRFLERIAGKMAEVSDVLKFHGDAFNYCMERLSDSDRALITRRYAPGVSVQLLATELNRPAHSVSKSLMRIRKTLLECIERRQREEERQ